MCGSPGEAWNLRFVERALCAESRCVHVVETESPESWYAGKFWGHWRVGAVEEKSLGLLVWSRKERHVYVAATASPSMQLSSIAAPWWRFVVSAPKTKGKRDMSVANTALARKGLAAKEGA